MDLSSVTNASTEELIARYADWLEKNEPEAYRGMQPGLTAAQVQEWETALEIELPADFKTFYQWRNGQTTEHCLIGGGYSFLSAEETGKVHQYWKRTLQEKLEHGLEWDDSLWNMRWVPFLSSWDMDAYICLDLFGSFTGNSRQILYCPMGGASYFRCILYVSFQKFLETLVLAREHGFYCGCDLIEASAWQLAEEYKYLWYGLNSLELPRGWEDGIGLLEDPDPLPAIV